MMKKQCSLPVDRISELPSHVAQTILTFLPLRDMVRTTVLSKHWRFQWVNVPQLVFKDDPKYNESREERYRYDDVKVFEILFQHRGPLLKLTLDTTSWLCISPIHEIIPVLSRNGIRELTLLMPRALESNMLPSSILSCVELRYLSLSRCVFQTRTISGFSKLVSLELLDVTLDTDDVSISSCPLLESLAIDVDIFATTVNLLNVVAPNLKVLRFTGDVSHIGVINTPHLKNLWLLGGSESFMENCSSDLISILRSLPLLEELRLSYKFLQALSLRDSPKDLLKGLDSLLILELDAVDLCHTAELSSTLWLIRNSPNIQKLKLMLCPPAVAPLEAESYMNTQNRSHYSLLKLQKVELVITDASRGDLSFVILFSKFLLDISPVLRTLYAEPYFEDTDVNGYKRFDELACHPCASPNAKVVYVGPESLNLPH